MRFNIFFLLALSGVNALALPAPVANNQIEARQIEAREIEARFGRTLLTGIKKALNIGKPTKNPTKDSDIPYTGPIINGRVKGPNGWEPYKAGTGQMVGGE